MGHGIRFKCTKCSCKYTAYLGTGMKYDKLYEETIKAARAGKFGDKYRCFLIEHPEGAIDCCQDIIYCRQCRRITTGLNLSLYLPKDGFDPKADLLYPWYKSFRCERDVYTVPFGLSQYDLFAQYPHRCEACGSGAQVISAKTLSELLQDGSVVCPDCGAPIIQTENHIMWD